MARWWAHLARAGASFAPNVWPAALPELEGALSEKPVDLAVSMHLCRGSRAGFARRTGLSYDAWRERLGPVRTDDTPASLKARWHEKLARHHHRTRLLQIPAPGSNRFQFFLKAFEADGEDVVDAASSHVDRKSVV